MKRNSFSNIVIILAVASFGISAAFADGPNGSASAGSNPSVTDHLSMTDDVESMAIGVVGGISVFAIASGAYGAFQLDPRIKMETSGIKAGVPSDAQLREIISYARKREKTSGGLSGGEIRVNMGKTFEVADERITGDSLKPHYIDLHQSDDAVLRELRGALEDGTSQGMSFAKMEFVGNLSTFRSVSRKILVGGLAGLGLAWDLGHFALQAKHYDDLSSPQCGPAVDCDSADKLVSSAQATSASASAQVSATASSVR